MARFSSLTRGLSNDGYSGIGTTFTPLPGIYLPAPSGDITGAADDAALAAALAQGTGVIRGQRGHYFLSVPPALANYQILDGVGGISGGALPGTTFQYVGPNAGSFITLGNIGSQVRDAMIFTGASFTGRVIDLSTNGATLPVIERCLVIATDTTAASLIYGDNSLDATVYKNNLVGGKYGIQGIATAGHFANGYSVIGNRIGGQGTAGGCIAGIGGGWLVGGNIFELQNGQAALRAGPSVAHGGALVGNWTGDAVSGTVVMELFANGLAIHGNYIAGNAGTGIKFLGTSDGISIAGNQFDFHTLGIDKNSQTVTNTGIGPNSYTNVGTHHNFTPTGAAYIEA